MIPVKMKKLINYCGYKYAIIWYHNVFNQTIDAYSRKKDFPHMFLFSRYFIVHSITSVMLIEILI